MASIIRIFAGNVKVLGNVAALRNVRGFASARKYKLLSVRSVPFHFQSVLQSDFVYDFLQIIGYSDKKIAVGWRR